MLLKLVVEVASLANSRTDFDPSWSVVITNLVSLYRNEDAKKRAIDNYIPPTSPSDARGPLIQDDGD